MASLFAAIADDFTGGSDLAGMLREQGVRTVLLFGVPRAVESYAGAFQAAVVCLKSRSIAAAEACHLSLEAARALAPFAPAQVQFKYCSTFDSTPAGNIGPVTDALLSHYGVDHTVAVPALPVNGRTQYLGHLFVQGQLLSESPLRDHPLNPMTDANLVRWLALQTSRRIGLIPLDAVRDGAAAVRERFASAGEIALVDATRNRDLGVIAEAVADLPLVTGGSGLASALARHWRARGRVRPIPDTASAPASGGTLVLAGSCSAMTLRQLALLGRSAGVVEEVALDLGQLLADPAAEVAKVQNEATARLRRGARVLLRSSAAAGERAAQGERVGEEAARELPARLEALFGEVARGLVAAGAARRIIVAGGETSGAVVEALGIEAAEVEAILDPGVPALRVLGGPPLRLALKSGNFGAEDFFLSAIRYLENS